jgi:hypothetical protein
MSNGGNVENAVGHTKADVITHERHTIFPLVVIVIVRTGIESKQFTQHAEVGF